MSCSAYPQILTGIQNKILVSMNNINNIFSGLLKFFHSIYGRVSLTWNLSANFYRTTKKQYCKKLRKSTLNIFKLRTSLYLVSKLHEKQLLEKTIKENRSMHYFFKKECFVIIISYMNLYICLILYINIICLNYGI